MKHCAWCGKALECDEGVLVSFRQYAGGGTNRLQARHGSLRGCDECTETVYIKLSGLRGKVTRNAD